MVVLLLCHRLQVFLWCCHQRRMCTNLARSLLMSPWEHLASRCRSICGCSSLVLLRWRHSIHLIIVETFSWPVSFLGSSSGGISRSRWLSPSRLWCLPRLLSRIVATSAYLTSSGQCTWLLRSQGACCSWPRRHILHLLVNFELHAPLPLDICQGRHTLTLTLRRISSSNVYRFLTGCKVFSIKSRPALRPLHHRGDFSFPTLKVV